MCVFYPQVELVANTRIFARVAGEKQLLAYQMNVDTSREVAMVLPIPLAPPRVEDRVRFINLIDYPELFTHLSLCFPPPEEDLADQPRGVAVAGAALAVRKVGSFEASVVPTKGDFSRLDPRFQLSDAIWEGLPDYDEFGFVVFQLRAGSQKVHPMAFEFATAEPNRAFFPTVHAHHGTVPKDAFFDHELYIQHPANPIPTWETSDRDPSQELDLNNVLKGDRTRGLVLAGAKLHRKRMIGYFSNADVWV